MTFYRTNSFRPMDLHPNWDLLLVTKGHVHLVGQFMSLLDPNPDSCWMQRKITQNYFKLDTVAGRMESGI